MLRSMTAAQVRAAARAPGLGGLPRSLLVAQMVGSLGLAAGGAAGPLLIAQLTGSDTLSAWPLGLLVLGAAMSAPLITSLMRRRGRSVGLLLSYLVATAGAWLVVIAAARGDVALLLGGSLLLGVGNTAVMLGRYVAADSAPAHRTGSAVSAAMMAVTVGAVAGPLLLAPGARLAMAWNLPAPVGLYLLAGVMFPVAAAVTLFLDRGVPARDVPTTQAASPRSDSQVLPLIVLGTANLTMVTVMAVTPAHLRMHGWSLGALGVLVAAHIAAMYGPSPLSGWIRDRCGSASTALLGSLALVAATVLLALSGNGGAMSVAGLLLLGLGWNCQLIGGTALLVDRTPRAARPRAEGLGEVAMGGAAAIGTLGAAAPLLALGGVYLLNGVAAIVTVAVAIPLVRQVRNDSRGPLRLAGHSV